MFDDQPTNINPVNNNPIGPGVPNNLPLAEPDDMFAGVEENVAPETVGEPIPEAAPAPEPLNTALGAGVLKPKNLETTSVPNESKYTLMPELNENGGQGQNPQEIYKLKEPILASGVVKLVLFLIVLAILGGVGWWAYGKFIGNNNKPAVIPEVSTGDNIDNGGEVNLNNDNIIDQNNVEPTPDSIATTSAAGTTDNNVLGNVDIGTTVQEQGVFFGQPIDSDGDGLDNENEQKLGTDPNNWDTDNDSLSDGDEVLIWKTNPLNPDTDGDSFKDGEEVKNGYNPLGTGKLFNVPTTTP